MTDDVKKVAVGEMCILKGKLWEFTESELPGCVRAVGYIQSDSELILDEVRETTVERMVEFFRLVKDIQISF